MTLRLTGRRALLQISAAALTLSLIGFAPARAADATVAVIVKDTTSFFFQIVLAGARKAGKDLGVKVSELGTTNEADVAGQISVLENAVAAKPLGVVIAAVDFKALGPPIDAAAKSVPVIGIDSRVNSQAFSSFLTTDNVAGGRLAADALAEAIKANTGAIKGDVALITNVPNAGALEDRKKGFIEELAAKYPDLHLAADKYSDGQATTGLNIATDLITANPHLVGIFASNLIQAQGAGQAVAENKAVGKVALVAFDSDDKLVGFLKDGTISALIVQDPFRMGYDGVKTALAVSKGEKVAANVDTGANVVTKANMTDPKMDALIHPKVN